MQARVLHVLRLAVRRTACSIERQTDSGRHALNQRFHTESCNLSPRQRGEKLWDGKNKGITLDDLRFLLERRAY